MRLYTFLLLIQIAKAKSRQDSGTPKGNCKKLRVYESTYGVFLCPNMEKGKLPGVGSYDEMMHNRFKKGIYKAGEGEFSKKNFFNDVVQLYRNDARDLKLDMLAERIRTELKTSAAQDKQGNIPFGLGCHGRGNQVVCTIKFEVKEPQEKPKKKVKEEKKDTKGAIQGPAPSTTRHRQESASGPSSSVQGSPERSGESSLGDHENPKLPSAVSERENGHSSSLEEGQVKPSSPDCLDKREHSERCPLTEERSGHQSNATGQGGPDLSQVEEGGPGPVTMVEEGPHPPRGEESEDQGPGQV